MYFQLPFFYFTLTLMLIGAPSGLTTEMRESTTKTSNLPSKNGANVL
jgi:hypothetical protein